MIRPSLDELKDFAGKYTIVPISLELFSDIKTPIETLKSLKAHSKKYYLLESVEGGDRWGRYSFLGFEPELTVDCTDGNPNETLRKILAEYKSPRFDFLPSFTGGFVGYMSYDYAKYGEKALKLENKNSIGFNDLCMMLFDKIVAFDHLRQKIVIIVNIKTEHLEKNYAEGVLKLKEIEAVIKSDSKEIYQSSLKSDFVPLFTKEKYCEMVETAKKHIYEGDIFQAVLANRLEAEFEGDMLSAYRVLRTINPSPYMFYIDFGSLQIAGASPETLIALKDSRLSYFPLAGTCPRGKNDEEDEKLISELLQNEKELAEHNMLVDLGRNDLGKISKFGTVKVTDYLKPVKFSHVTHISSTVNGVLKDGLDQLDALAAVLPSGTLSGAPKIKAMEIINELEGEKRGIYGGAIGYIDFSGNMDMCIAIRMAVKKDNKVYVSAGAGIVADSIPENEYNECMNKAKAMIEALTVRPCNLGGGINGFIDR